MEPPLQWQQPDEGACVAVAETHTTTTAPTQGGKDLTPFLSPPIAEGAK